MTQNTPDIKIQRKRKSYKALLLSTSMCVAILLNGCNGSELTHVNGAFNKPWEEIASEKMSHETSHMKQNANDGISIEKANSGNPAPSVESASLTKQAYNKVLQEEKRIIPVPPTPAPHNASTKNIFGKNLRSDSDRLDRLERAVQNMRNDFNSVQPSIRRLMAIEGDIQSLISELEQLNADPSLAKSPARKTYSKPKSNKPTIVQTHRRPTATSKTSKKSSFVKKSAPAMSGSPDVYDIRIGEHPGKTRIVMDVNSKTSFNVDIDNNEHIMIIDLPNAKWSAAMSKNFAKSPFITSYNVESSGSGHMAIFQLKKNARVGYKADLSGFQGSSRRLVIDVTN